MARLRQIAIPTSSNCLLLVTCFIAVVHAQRERQSSTTMYRGIVLPPAPAVQGVSAHPPPAWFVIGKKATAASFGSFCYATACVDMIPPSSRPDIAKVVVRGRHKGFALIRSHVIAMVSASLHPWGAPTSSARGRPAVRRRQDGTWTVLHLTLPRPLDDELLEVDVTFTAGDDATYLWRLNPSS